jgi:hypothetical protein
MENQTMPHFNNSTSILLPPRMAGTRGGARRPARITRTLAVMTTAGLAIAAPLPRPPVPAASTSATFLNGADPRPFYIFAHNPNTPHDVEVSLQAGANALEPDITATTCEGAELLVDFDSSCPAG